jgi:hypothetical protein
VGKRQEDCGIVSQEWLVSTLRVVLKLFNLQLVLNDGIVPPFATLSISALPSGASHLCPNAVSATVKYQGEVRDNPQCKRKAIQRLERLGSDCKAKESN